MNRKTLILSAATISIFTSAAAVHSQPQNAPGYEPGAEPYHQPPMPPEFGEGSYSPPPFTPLGLTKNGDQEERRQQMLKRFDTNNDGTLDENERAKMRAEMQKRWKMRQQEGAGGIGSNDPSRTPGSGGGWREDGDKSDWQARRQRMLQQFDTNHDGKLDEQERSQMRAAMEKQRQDNSFPRPSDQIPPGASGDFPERRPPGGLPGEGPPI